MQLPLRFTVAPRPLLLMLPPPRANGVPPNDASCCTSRTRTSAPRSRRWWRRCRRWRASSSPTCVILSGDITQRARSAQFAAARALLRLARRRRALLALPGNHDIPLFNVAGAAVRARMATTCDCFGAELEPVLRTADVLVIGVNTTRPGAAQGRRGVAGADRARGRRGCSARRPAQLRIVVTHQPAVRDAAGRRAGPAARRRGGGAGLGARRCRPGAGRPHPPALRAATCARAADGRRRARCGACRPARRCRTRVRHGTPQLGEPDPLGAAAAGAAAHVPGRALGLRPGATAGSRRPQIATTCKLGE